MQVGASDLHVFVGHPPVIRLHGDLAALPEAPAADERASPARASTGTREKVDTLKTWSRANKVAAVVLLLLFVGGYAALIYFLVSNGKFG